jgi:hypothetical protein
VAQHRLAGPPPLAPRPPSSSPVPPAARRHPSNADAPPRHVSPAPLPQRLPPRPEVGSRTAAAEGSIDEITALMDFLRRDDPPGD